MAIPQESELGAGDATPKLESTLHTHEEPCKGGNHVQGILPASAYMPIKDFVRGVQPKGTAREVFEGVVCEALPKVGKCIPWFNNQSNNQPIT